MWGGEQEAISLYTHTHTHQTPKVFMFSPFPKKTQPTQQNSQENLVCDILGTFCFRVKSKDYYLLNGDAR